MQQYNAEILMRQLKERRVSITRNRLAVLKVLCEQRTALTVTDITRLSPIDLDRISVYRTLQFFGRKGVIYQVPNTMGEIRYILAGNPLNGPAKNTSNIIFALCMHCGYTELVENTGNYKVGKPEHIDVRKCTIIIEGLCQECKDVG